MENKKNQKLEFKTFGITIEKLSVVYGLFLIVWGLIVSIISGSNSFTSYIPTILGVPILIFSFLALKFITKKKLFMHIVVLFGLIIFIGGLDFLRSMITGSLFNNLWADISKLILLTTGLFFSIQCIRSFIYARKNNSS
tara:strand:+ start:629 stop:1045 length:417 start_codon:yes stop_codon:yes gene_type:complete